MDERVQETFLTFVGNALFDTRCDAASVAAWDVGITKNISDTSSFIQTVLLVPDSHRISRRMHLRVADLRMTYYRQ